MDDVDIMDEMDAMDLRKVSALSIASPGYILYTPEA